jgi:hypothetical protein
MFEDLLRLIEQAERLRAAIREQKIAGGNDGAMQEIEKACLRSIGLPLSVVRRSSPELLLDLLKQNGDFYYRAVLLAELLLQCAEINEEEGKLQETVVGQLQAYCLLAESLDVLSPEEKAIYRPKLDTLAIKLSAFKDDPYIQQKLTLRADPGATS